MHQTSSRKRKKNPREAAGIFSILTFFYSIDIFKQANIRDIDESDVYEVTTVAKSESIGDKIQEEWEKELKMKRHASLGKTLFRVFGTEYMLYGLVNLVFSVSLMLVSPWATGKLVSFFDDDSIMPKWQAVWYAIILISSGFVRSFYTQYYGYCIQHLSLRVRVALTALIYRKSLKLTASSLTEITNGKIVTLIAKDVEYFETALMLGHGVWIGALLLCVMTVVMYRVIGVSAFVGVTFILSMIPLQAWLAVKTKQLRLKSSAKTDERLRRIQELLTSIKLIKLFTWEKYYTKIVKKLRCEEIKQLRYVNYLRVLTASTKAMYYRMSFFLCLSMYALLGNHLTAEKAFVVVSCFNWVDFFINFGAPLSLLAEAKSALKRMKGYLLMDERLEPKRKHATKTGKVNTSNVEVKINDSVVLKDIRIEVTAPSLVGITGDIASGKSSFLKMILQDIDISNGQVLTTGKMSYASQEPWLFPGTIRENILFGNSYNENRYDRVLHVCALKKDLKTFPMRDMTVVNDKGLNLSRGQQARINLARAIYQESDIYLLDDIMSSLDANVSRYIFDHCIKKFLGDKLCFLVCHSKKYLARVDKIIIFEEGVIKAQGTLNQLKCENIRFDTVKKIEIIMMEAADHETEKEVEETKEDDWLLKSRVDSVDNIFGETQQQGEIKWDVYKAYIYFGGGWLVVLLACLLCASTEITGISFDQYITKWLDVQAELRIATDLEGNQENITKAREDNVRALSIYCGIVIVYIALIIVSGFVMMAFILRAARTLHDHVFMKIMGAVVPFFDAHLSGTILNRLSKDTCVMEEFMVGTHSGAIMSTFGLCFKLGAIFYIQPVMVVPALVFFAITWYACKVFLRSSRSLRRLEVITRAPLVGYLNASLEGLTTIRATGHQHILEKQFDEHQDLNSSVTLMIMASLRGFALWIEILTNVYNILLIFSFLIYDTVAENSGYVGFVITQFFGVSMNLQACVREWAEVESNMTSVERLLEYSKAEQEDHADGKATGWPTDGEIAYKDVQMHYPLTKNFVLQGVNFFVRGGEKVGIVGRTGAGKSSIISALFRLYKCEGSIMVDGTDVNSVDLLTLRSKMSVIPQDPVMFKGTVRTNLDPYEDYTDLDIWNALEDVGLKTALDSLGLNSVVEEGGSNWTIGQRQLFSLARTVLRNNKIVVLDEATANIDPNTDVFIQTAIKRLFKHCTILTIAHRINTVINSEKIMVIDNGVVVEFDSPQNLLSTRRGAFYTVAHEAGLVD